MVPYLRKFLSAAMPAVAIIMVVACQSINPEHQSPSAIYALHLMANQPAQLANLLETVKNGKQAIIKIVRGQPIPLQIVLDSPVAKIDKNQNEIRLIFNQDIYISLSNKKTLISTDGRQWKDITDLQALKQIFDFRSGNIKFSLAQQGDESVSLVTILETHPF